MNQFFKYTTIFLLAVLLFACEEEEITEDMSLRFRYDFIESVEGWAVGFSDYPVGEDDFYELDSSWTLLPFPLNPIKKSLMIEGNNHSDDLFMYIKKKVEGLEANTTYNLNFFVEFASNYPENSFGIGGSPGSSVYVKTGASLQEPLSENQNGQWQLNIDKGNQAQGGQDMMVLGTVGTSREDEQYDLVRKSNTEEQEFQIKTDDRGEIWLIVGTDSGFEGKTRLYYNRIIVSFVQPEE